jgi:TPP-dependent indolepyruvate ferredoxin oxidoreductase alpha subunit
MSAPSAVFLSGGEAVALAARDAGVALGTGYPGAPSTEVLELVSAGDPGMASSQNEQDNRRYAVAAAVPMLEPADSQESYDYTLLAIGVSERWSIPVLLRMTTRVCHSKTLLRQATHVPRPSPAEFVRDVPSLVMIPAYARHHLAAPGAVRVRAFDSPHEAHRSPQRRHAHPARRQRLPFTGRIRLVLGLRVEVSLVKPTTIQRSEGKAKRVIGRRSQ